MITDYIRIKNFKSINELTLKDCKRINLLIGPPNVGKSNMDLLFNIEAFPEDILQYLHCHPYDSDVKQMQEIMD